MRRRWLRDSATVLILAGGLFLWSVLSVDAQLSPAPLVEVPAVPPLLPWLPLLSGPRPTPPFLPPDTSDAWSVEAEQPSSPEGLADFIATLQRALDLLNRWAGFAQQVASGTLGRMIWESPGHLPQGAELPDLLGQIRLLPHELRSALEMVLAKLRAPVRPGSVDARHQNYVGSSPVVAHEASGIADSDAVVAGAAVQQAAATRATALAAAALAHDRGLGAAVSAAHETGRTLVGEARGLPSSRAGIELLVAGVGSELEQEAEFHAAVAQRLTVLAQQNAEVSQQIGSLATIAGVLTLREAERDRLTLDAHLGLADTVTQGARALEEMLSSAGAPPSDELRIDPLY
jgi:hypothetical protein